MLFSVVDSNGMANHCRYNGRCSGPSYYYYYEDDDYDDAIFLGLIETGFIPFWVGVCLI